MSVFFNSLHATSSLLLSKTLSAMIILRKNYGALSLWDQYRFISVHRLFKSVRMQILNLFYSFCLQDWLPNTNSAILVENYPSIKELADVITEINNNDTLYKSFMSHKTHKQIQNEFLKEKLGQGRFGLETDQEFTITAFECFVCRKLHKNDWNEKRTESIYNCPNPRTLNWTSKENTWYQHWAVGKCQAKALQFFLESDRPYTQEQFKGKWEDYLKYNEC